jgi:hypothetical protein
MTHNIGEDPLCNITINSNWTPDPYWNSTRSKQKEFLIIPNKKKCEKDLKKNGKFNKSRSSRVLRQAVVMDTVVNTTKQARRCYHTKPNEFREI